MTEVLSIFIRGFRLRLRFTPRSALRSRSTCGFRLLVVDCFAGAPCPKLYLLHQQRNCLTQAFFCSILKERKCPISVGRFHVFSYKAATSDSDLAVLLFNSSYFLGKKGRRKLTFAYRVLLQNSCDCVISHYGFIIL